MAVVVVQVGQCGNQVGDELFSQLAAITGIGISPPPGCSDEGGERTARTPRATHANPSSSRGPLVASAASPFFTKSGFARCVLVDSEPKVVHGVLKRHPHFIRKENVVCGQSGRGNNWGLGYYGVNDPHSKRTEHRSAATSRAFKNLHKAQRVQDDGLFTNALRAIHSETRRTADAEDFEAIIMIHSLSGGTGSGLASRLAERIRLYFVEPPDGAAGVDEVYEDKMRRLDGLDGMLVEKRRARYFVAIPLAPMAIGEMSTQGINAALTMQVLLKQADALLLLRNDDALSPGDARGCSSSTSAGAGEASLLPKCMTFKEANELLVGMLLPIFHYGTAAHCGVESLIRQCAPRGAADTGGNVVLTLLPTPQRVYERFRGCAHRARFYALHEGKEFLPGCKPEFPESVVLCPGALREGGEESGTRQGTKQRGRGGGRAGGRRPLWQAVNRRRPATEAEFHLGRDDGDDAVSPHGSQAEDEEDACYCALSVTVPAAIREYYRLQRRSPVSTFLDQVEGVAVLNQTRELNPSLIFPLLRSAALKVKVGAYVSPYQDVGVTTARIEEAYRNVAEAMLNGE